MEKDRKIKILSIVALVLAITGMSLGFAAFSSTLTISSSARVTPNSENFKIKIYGIASEDALNRINNGELSESFFSETYSIAVASKTVTSADNAVINNQDLSISNIHGTFVKPNSKITYTFLIVNEGAYDAYFNIKDYLGDFLTVSYNYGPTCIPGEGATPELVELACQGFEEAIVFQDSSGNILTKENDVYFLATGEVAVMIIQIDYLYNIADGPFEVQFNDLQLDFSTSSTNLKR